VHSEELRKWHFLPDMVKMTRQSTTRLARHKGSIKKYIKKKNFPLVNLEVKDHLKKKTRRKRYNNIKMDL
jgi:hypothetical protein